MMCMSGTPKGMEASLSASFWISFWKASLSPFRNGSMRLFRIFSKTSTLFCTAEAREIPQCTLQVRIADFSENGIASSQHVNICINQQSTVWPGNSTSQIRA